VLAALCATMCAFCVKNIFLRIYKLFGIFIIALQSTSIGFLKIGALHDVPFTPKSFLSFLTTDEKWKN